MEDAIHYLSNHWDAFVRYLEDGRLEMTNGRSERAIKDFVIGRKNWLFCNTERGAEASSDAYSLAATIKANHLKPYEYITYVLEEMTKMESPDEKKLRELLPFSGTLPARLKAQIKNELDV